jgi:hypothetical protein
VSIFKTLQLRLDELDSRAVLDDVMIIADEVDLQLIKTMSIEGDERHPRALMDTDEWISAPSTAPTVPAFNIDWPFALGDPGRPPQSRYLCRT